MIYPEELRVNDNRIKISYKKAKGFSSSVKLKQGEIVINLSRFLVGDKKRQTIEKFLKWAEKRLSKVVSKDFINPIYKDGARICTHNKSYEINVFFEDRKTIRSKLSNRGVIKIIISESEPEKKIQDIAEKMIIKDQKEYLCEVLDELNQLYFQEKYNLVRFKRMKSRFGSCSSKRNINIAYRLLFAPREVFRYVCLHELAHLKEMNHSRKFWDLVEDAMPNYKEQEKWLRCNGFFLD